MGTTTVRVSEETRHALRELAAASGEPMQQVLAQAVEFYREHRFWERVNAAYAVLRSDPAAWQEELAERAAWDTTLGDGLKDFPK